MIDSTLVLNCSQFFRLGLDSALSSAGKGHMAVESIYFPDTSNIKQIKKGAVVIIIQST